MRYRFKLINFHSSEKNRFQKPLTVSNIIILSVVSDTFGKSSSAIIKYAMEHPDDLDIDYSQFLYKSMIAKADKIKIISSAHGLTIQSAISVISEIGTNMLVFKDVLDNSIYKTY